MKTRRSGGGLRLGSRTSDTKYRVIADGNLCRSSPFAWRISESDTKYRVIADGNKPAHG